MTSPLQAAGAITGQSQYAPIYTNRFITGLWTQRNPMRDAATPYLYEKFYSGSRYESLIDGLNSEITSRLTLKRRAGCSNFNSLAAFGGSDPVNRFYPFKIFSTDTEIIKLIADTNNSVSELIQSPANTQNIFYNKTAYFPVGGRSYFQSVGNSLFWGDGLYQKKWTQTAKTWLAATVFNSGDFIVEKTYNTLQVALGARTGDVSSVSITANVATIIFKTRIALKFYAGMYVIVGGLTNAAFMNSGAPYPITEVGYNFIKVAFVHANYGPTADTGTVSCAGGATGGVEPTWGGGFPPAKYSIQADGNQQWLCLGSSVQNWGIEAPAGPPTAVNSARPTAYPNWAANTIYSPSLSIVDTNGNIQTAIVAGTTGAGAPVWNVVVGGNTVDNTVTWKNMGTATRANLTAYALGYTIKISRTYYVTVPPHCRRVRDDVSGGAQGFEFECDGGDSYAVTFTAFFKATVAGNSGASEPAWPDGIGTTIQDGTVTWQNIGADQLWVANTAINFSQVVLDANGNRQQIVTPGKSGAVAPAWATATGATTIDNAATWTNAGVYSAANTGAWAYGYAFKNSVDSAKSTVSDASDPVVMAANKEIIVQGDACTDEQCDVVQIYRTAQGGSTLVLLDEIPNPTSGKWTYEDTSADSNLNETSPAPLLNTPPPTGLIALEYHFSRIWGAVGNTVYYANAGNNQAFARTQSFVYPAKVTRLWSTTIGLLVFTVSDVYLIRGKGTDTDAFWSAGRFIKEIGLSNWDAFTVVGSTAYMMTNSRKVISLDPGAGVTEVGFPIGDQFALLYDPATTTLTWHEGQSGDSALYVGDNTLGWFRMSPISAPESGFVWSPRAAFAKGCNALQSVEVAPGDRRLLFQQMLSDIRGPIVQRDLTVSNDNGTRIFSPRTTIGSLTLAQPGQIAELDFVTTDTVRVGTRVVIGMLLDEINATMADPVAPPTKILINHQLSPPTIFIKYTYWNNEGETAASLALKTVREDIEIAGPPAIAGALGYNVYTGATEDACRLQQHVTGFGNSGGIAFAFAPQPLAPIMNSEFEQIKRSRQDPPLLPPSRSLYNDRYYLAQNQTPTFCRHLQIQFAWADEAAANELLTYTIFGAIYQEGRTA